MRERERCFVSQGGQDLGKTRSASKSQAPFGTTGVIDPADRRRQRPPALGVKLPRLREMAGNHGHGVCLQLRRVGPAEWGRRGNEKDFEAQRCLLQRGDMSIRCVLYGEAPV